jgi:Protein of unknown function (DUF998)
LSPGKLLSTSLVRTVEEGRMEGDRTTRLMLAAGVIGPVLFVIVALIEGATRPGYSAWRHFVSQLSLSDQGWTQIVNFIVCGLLVLCFALGLRRALGPGRGMTWGPALLAVFGLGLIAAGLFVTDPALGYPPGAPNVGPQTLHGNIHGLAGLVSFGSLAAACFVLARRFAGDPEWRGWTAYSIATGAVVVVFFIASIAASVLDANGTVPNAPTGVLQRITILLGWSWVALLALRVIQHQAKRGIILRKADGIRSQ